MYLRVDNFRGINRVFHSRVTENSFADCAINTCFDGGVLKPHLCPVNLCSESFTVKDIYSSRLCDCVGFDRPTPLTERGDKVFFVDDDGYLKESTEHDFCDTVSCLNGVPCPSGVPSVSGGGGEDCDVVFVRLMYTYVKEYGDRCEEGPPSLATGQVAISDCSSVSLGGVAPPPAGYCISKIRVYAAVSGHHSGAEGNLENTSDFGLVGEFPVGGVGFTLCAKDVGMGITSEYYDLPPRYMKGVVTTKDGLAGFKGDVIYITEPGLTHAWGNEICLHEKILALEEYRGDLYAFTECGLFYIQRQGPSRYSPTKLTETIVLELKNSVTVGNSGIVFVTKDGIMHWVGSQVRNLIEGYLSKTEWCKINVLNNKTAIRRNAYYFSAQDGSYVLEFGDGLFDNSNGNFYQLPFMADAWKRTCDDRLLFSEGQDIKEFDHCCISSSCGVCQSLPKTLCEECCPYFWRGRIRVKPYFGTWSTVKVHIDPRTGSTVFRLYRVDCDDRVLIWEQEINNAEDCCDPDRDQVALCPEFTFKIPSCKGLWTDYDIELEGCAHVYFVALANSRVELGQEID